MGRRKATECYLIQAWQSTDYHRCKFRAPAPCFSRPLATSFPSRSYANSSSRPSRHKSEGHPLIYMKRSMSHTHCSRFGWFWQCPNEESCQYRHALPPGFVLKSQKKAMEEAEKANQISLEEFLEVEVRPIFILPRAIRSQDMIPRIPSQPCPNAASQTRI